MKGQRWELPLGFWLGRPAICFSRDPWKRDRAGSHWGGLEGPRRASWNVPSLITLGFSPLRTFFRLIHCENLGCFFFLPPHLSPSSLLSASLLSSCGEEKNDQVWGRSVQGCHLLEHFILRAVGWKHWWWGVRGFAVGNLLLLLLLSRFSHVRLCVIP